MIIRHIQVDSNNDWLLSEVTKSDAIKQAIKQALQSISNDWFLNLEHGIDLEQFSSLPYNDNKNNIENTIKNIIFEVKGVINILSYKQNYNSETRQLDIYIDYIDIYSNTNNVKVTM